MNGRQTAILWMGLILVLVRGITNGQFSLLWSTVETPAAKPKTSSTTSSNSSAESGFTGTVTAV